MAYSPCLKWNLIIICVEFFYLNLNMVQPMLNEEILQQQQQQSMTPVPVESSSISNLLISSEKSLTELTCFHAGSSEICHESNFKDSNIHCKFCRQELNALICCNITDINQVKNCTLNRKFKNIHIRNLTMQELSITSLNSFKESTSLAITDGNIFKITDQFSLHSNLKCLNISNNNLTEFTDQRALTSLISKQLQILDLSHNLLSKIPITNSHKHLSLDIRNNSRMLCNLLNDAIDKGNAIFIEPNNTLCRYDLNIMHSDINIKSDHWVNSTELVSISQLISMRKLKIECPIIPGHGNCSCKPERILFSDVDVAQVSFTVKVDCSSMGLNKLPQNLPINTVSLNVSHNEIFEFGDNFHSNPHYFNIIYLDIDNNKISSIYELEGTKFFENFQKFFLRGNLIDKIPEYLLSNALDYTPKGGGRLYLAGNKVTCDCNTAKVLKFFLLARQNSIPDFAYILCNNIPQKVIDLTEIKLCQSPHDWTDYIYYLIALEVFLLVALIMKVSYDYYKFIYHGYLPWPASKIIYINCLPFKLPCDWICES